MSEWVKICAVSDLIADAGVPALFKDQAIALFYVNDQVYALSNYDPIGQANVMSRGIVGSIKGELVVASPLYKEHYSLSTGKCLEKPEVALTVYSVKVEGGDVWVS
ncbi:MAG: nitrite reductase small subunit NirD [Thiotrichales bacterium]|jgi:nitrite reductase (NADH) small subunit|nr:nitrite reductase small subunit NirD [Thiotrichales bacterium]